MKSLPPAGPTGQFPRGKLRPDDRGELCSHVRVERGSVVIEFGTQVSWLSLPPDAARAFASILVTYADAAERDTPSTEKDGRKGFHP
jgi:hypothetical protein